MVEASSIANWLDAWRFEHRIVRRDGTVVWVQGNAMPRRAEDGSTLWNGMGRGHERISARCTPLEAAAKLAPAMRTRSRPSCFAS